MCSKRWVTNRWPVLFLVIINSGRNIPTESCRGTANGLLIRDHRYGQGFSSNGELEDTRPSRTHQGRKLPCSKRAPALVSLKHLSLRIAASLEQERDK